MYTLSLIISFLSSMFLLFLVILMLVRDYKSTVNRYLAYWMFCGFGIIITMFMAYFLPDSKYLTQINRVTQLSTILTFSGTFAMSFVFPKTDRNLPFYLIPIFLIPAYIVGIIIVFTDFSITRAYFENGILNRDYTITFGTVRFYDIYLIISLIYLLLGIGNFARKYIKTRVDFYKLQIRYTFLGTSFALTAGSIGSLILPRFFNISEFYISGASLSATFIVISVFYSTSTYNLMDIKTTLKKMAMYSLMAAVILIPIAGVYYIYHNNYFSLNRVESHIIAGSVAGLFLLVSIFIQPVIDRVFLKRTYEFESMVKSFIADIEKLKDFDSVVKRAVDILHDNLHLKKTFFMILDDKTRRYEVYYSRFSENDVSVQPVERNADIIRWFVKNQDILRLERVYSEDHKLDDERENFLKFFLENGIKIIMPIYHESRVFGIICLGEKESLDGFNPDEMKELEFFMKNCNSFISISITYKKSIEDQYISRTVVLSSELQTKTIPQSLPNLSSIKFGAFYIPKYSDESNYFDFVRPSGQGVGVIATDISGVGINTALYSVLLRAAFQTSINEAPSTFTVMQKLNRVIYEYAKGNPGLVTSQYFYYDIKSMKLMYTNAGFPPLEVFRIDKNNFDSLDTEGVPLGNDPRSSYGIGRTNLLRGDIGILYSKSFVSSRNQEGNDFSLSRLRKLVADNRVRKPSEISERIKNSFETFMGMAAPSSDVFVLVFKIV